MEAPSPALDMICPDQGQKRSPLQIDDIFISPVDQYLTAYQLNCMDSLDNISFNFVY